MADSVVGWEEVEEAPSLEDVVARVERDFRTPKRLRLLQSLLAVDAETSIAHAIFLMPMELSTFPIPVSPNARPAKFEAASKTGLVTVAIEGMASSE
jgi:hypothetical protein